MSAQCWNLAQALDEPATAWPDRLAVVGTVVEADGRQRACGELTFRELVRQVRACSAGWTKRGIARGDRVLIMARPSVDYMVATFALLRAGAIPVFIDGGLPVERIVQLMIEADAVGLLAGPEALAFKAAYAAPFASVRVTVSVDAGDAPDGVHALVADGAAATAPAPAPVAPDDVIAIAFTSGSTGLPKGVECTARMGRAGTDWLATEERLGAHDVFLAILPSHLFGALTLGVTCVLPAIDVARPGSADPAVIVRQILEHEISYTVGPPSLWARIAEYCDAHSIALPSLRRVGISGAPVATRLLRTLTPVLPSGEVRTPLGATEGAPLADIGAREILAETAARSAQGAGVCVGRAIAGHEIKIIEISPGPLPHWSLARELPVGAVGELVVHGPVVSARYFRRDADTHASKITDEQGRTWHRLGDCGYRDSQDRIWYCGRIAHIVGKGDARLYSVAVEGAFDEHPHVNRSALVKAQGAPGAPVAIVIETRSTLTASQLAELRESILATSAQLGWPIEHVLVYPGEFPVDARHNSKIERGELARWAGQTLSSRETEARPTAS